MEKVCKLKNLGCAHCAAKMESKIHKLPGVNGVTINFMTQRLTLDVEEERLEEILERAGEICKKIEPECELVP